MKLEKESAELSKNAEQDLLKRIDVLKDKLKFTQSSEYYLSTLKAYISNTAPIIICVHLEKILDKLVNDTNYRNQFETNTTSGSNDLNIRKAREKNLFGEQYDKVPSQERVKYGCLNFTNNIEGVPRASRYGKSYFVLNHQVRYRCTITNQDSFKLKKLVKGTIDHNLHILRTFQDEELEKCLLAANNLNVSNIQGFTYKEVQIHGQVEFSKDIDKLYIDKKLDRTPEFNQNLQKFLEKFPNIKLIQEDK